MGDDFAALLLQKDDPYGMVQQLNGSFLLVLETPDRVSVINDRFASIPLYYALVQGQLLFSNEYHVIWSRLRELGSLKINPGVFYEFLHLQRLLGDRTYDRETRALPPASILEFNSADATARLRSYWSPDFAKRRESEAVLADQLAEGIAASVRRRTSDEQRYGLLLSGGLDSRAVLVGFPMESAPMCYTIGDTKNNEVAVAAEIASRMGAPHEFLKRIPTHYEDILSSSARVGGGMHVIDHGHFFNFGSSMRENVDVVLHGHGMDYLFRGMYLPARRLRILGRRTFWERLVDLRGRVAEAYCESVKYRLKGLDPLSLILPEKREQMEEGLRQSVVSELQAVESKVEEGYDLWDYLHCYHPSRHYTYLNVLSIGDGVEQRTVAFDNDLYDLYWSMPAAMRLQGRVFKRALQRMRPAIAGVRNANTNLSATASPARLTLTAAKHAMVRKAPGLATRHYYPGPEDRSWPDRDEMVRRLPVLASRARDLARSELLAALDLFDMDALGRLVGDHFRGTRQAGAAILTLITMDEFLRQAGTPWNCRG